MQWVSWRRSMITGTSTLTSSSHTYGGSASSVSLGRCVGAQGHRLPSVCANPGFLQMRHPQRHKVLGAPWWSSCYNSALSLLWLRFNFWSGNLDPTSSCCTLPPTKTDIYVYIYIYIYITSWMQSSAREKLHLSFYFFNFYRVGIWGLIICDYFWLPFTYLLHFRATYAAYGSSRVEVKSEVQLGADASATAT